MGYLEENDVVCVKDGGLAIVSNIVHVLHVTDLYAALSCPQDPSGNLQK